MVLEGGVYIIAGAEITVLEGAHLHIQRNVDINRRNIIVCSKEIWIGEGVKCAPDVTIRDARGHKPAGQNRVEPIIIGKHAWACTGVTILLGVRIGEGSVLGVHSLDNKKYD